MVEMPLHQQARVGLILWQMPWELSLMLAELATLQRPVQLPAATWNRLPSTMPALSKISSSGSSPVHNPSAAYGGMDVCKWPTATACGCC